MKSFLKRVLAALDGGCKVEYNENIFNRALDVSVEVPNCLDAVWFRISQDELAGYLIGLGVVDSYDRDTGLVALAGIDYRPVLKEFNDLLMRDETAKAMVRAQIDAVLPMLDYTVLQMVQKQKGFGDMDMLQRQALLHVLRVERANPDVMGFVKTIWWNVDGHGDNSLYGYQRPEVMKTIFFLRDFVTPLSYAHRSISPTVTV